MRSEAMDGKGRNGDHDKGRGGKKDVQDKQKLWRGLEVVEEELAKLREEYKALMEDRHVVFLKQLESKKQDRDSKLWLAEQSRKYQIEMADRVHHSKVARSNKEYETGRKEIDEETTRALTQIIQQQETNKQKDQRTTKKKDPYAGRAMTRALRKRTQTNMGHNETDTNDKNSNGKRKFNPPSIQYTLTDEEILNDLSEIFPQSVSNPPVTRSKKRRTEKENLG